MLNLLNTIHTMISKYSNIAKNLSDLSFVLKYQSVMHQSNQNINTLSERKRAKSYLKSKILL